MTNIYDIGKLVRITGTFTRGITDGGGTAGDAIDPDVVNLDIKPPDGITATYVYGTDAEFVRDSTGVYHIDLSLDIAGPWAYRMYSTGTGKTATQSILKVHAFGF